MPVTPKDESGGAGDAPAAQLGLGRLSLASTGTFPGPSGGTKAGQRVMPFICRRAATGALTLATVSVLIFIATMLLPGNVATAILGQTATPERRAEVERQLNLDRPAVQQYLDWIAGILHGDPGRSLTNGQTVISEIVPRLENSAALVLAAACAGTIIGVTLGVVSAIRRRGWIDNVLSSLTLTLVALPQFIVGVALVSVFSTLVFHALPAVSLIPPGSSAWQHPELLILPSATLTLIVAPYIARMTRAVIIESLTAEYAEFAVLNGLPRRRLIWVHVLPASIVPILQVIGLNLLYLAGGTVVTEYVFNFQGIGQGLVSAVASRDVPVVQFIVLVMAGFYILTNLAVDALSLQLTPRRRLGRS